MAKNYIVNENYDKAYKGKDGFEWKYYSNKKMIELFSKDYKKKIEIIGEVITSYDYRKDVILYDNHQLSVGNIGSSKKIFRKVVGYIECGENEYVAIVKNDWAKLIIAILAIIAIFASIFVGMSSKKDDIGIDKDIIDYVANLERPEDWDPTKIILPGFNEIKAKYTEGAAYVALSNPLDNPVYFQYDVTLDETGESLLKTGLIPPGKAVTKLPLNKALKPGSYDITLNISTYSLEDHTQPMNAGAVKTKLIILE